MAEETEERCAECRQPMQRRRRVATLLLDGVPAAGVLAKAARRSHEGRPRRLAHERGSRRAPSATLRT